MIRFLAILFFISLLLSNNRIVHVNSTYYDGTPKEIIIYEYSTLYTNNPLKIIDKLHFSRNGNIIFDFDNYFNGKWKILINDEYAHTAEIFNDEFRFLKPSENCLDCYLSAKWDLSFNESTIIVEAQSDLSIYTPFESTMKYSVEILSPYEFKITGGKEDRIQFIKI